MKEALSNLLRSMKFWTAVVGILATMGAKYGIQVDAATQAEVVGFFIVLLGAQGAADHGKVAAQISASAAAAAGAPPAGIVAGPPIVTPPATPLPLPPPPGGAS